MATPRPGEVPEPAKGVISRSFGDDGDEYVLYAQDSGRAASLTGASAKVWRAAQGGPAPDVPPEQVEAAVGELTELGFLRAAVSRRTVLRGAAVAGGSLVALTGIETIIAPLPAAAESGGGSTIGEWTFTLAPNTTATFTIGGAGGGGGTNADGTTTAPGGAGGIMYGTIDYTGSTSVVLAAYVGTGGSGAAKTTGGAGGAGFGSASGGNGGSGIDESAGGGGGGSAIYVSATPADLLAAAGGGGGGGGFYEDDPTGAHGGAGALSVATTGAAGVNGTSPSTGGGGGSITAGGTAGAGVTGGAGTAGGAPSTSGGKGGTGGSGADAYNGGGGGGGGYSGGGGGGGAASESIGSGGGAGAGYAAGATVTNYTVTAETYTGSVKSPGGASGTSGVAGDNGYFYIAGGNGVTAITPP